MGDLTQFQLFTLFFVIFFYHIAEYLLAKHFHPESTTASSFLITWHYLIAFTTGLVEYLIERYFWPVQKTDSSSFVIWFGFILIIVGLYIRFAAIITGGKSFNHEVQNSKSDDHVLVTNGIYKYFRHPGYFGFFVFAIGTQLLLKNIISTIAFIFVLWNFFNDRIHYEEMYLIQMFGNAYIEYRRKTPTWIPFIQ